MAKIEEKEWTLIFYFASDTMLAPEIVSQLKAIKQAGFHQNVNVVAQFDPNTENAETHIFDVNRVNKIQSRGDSKGENKIGYIGIKPNDPYVVNLMTDKLWRDDEKEGEVRELVINYLKESIPKNRKSIEPEASDFDPPVPPLPFETERESIVAGTAEDDELIPQHSLASFLKFCSDNYPARHYILFILGHGLVVGNDTFLFDEHAPEHFLKLQTLRQELETFKKNIRDDNPKAEFELISFHSCSMSSLEVACEIQGIANYMLASQSPSFVGSWPYRQILIRMFNYIHRVEKGTEKENVKGLFTNFFHYCLYNGNDFLVAGYSSDLCLCDLNQVSDIEGPISDLSVSLTEGLSSKNAQVQKSVQECILLAHLEAQSYFNENYADIFDFCLRLQQRLEKARLEPPPTKVEALKVEAIITACRQVMEVLKRGVYGQDNGFITRSEFLGPTYQYSHGLSLYYPWAKPAKSKFWPDEYEQYQFVVRARENKREGSWSDFLKLYFEKTRRGTRMGEFGMTDLPGAENEVKKLGFKEQLLAAFVTSMFNSEGQLNSDNKPSPNSSQGSGCDCQSIKNYPPFTREPAAGGAANGQVPVIPDALDDPSFISNEDGTTFALDGLV